MDRPQQQTLYQTLPLRAPHATVLTFRQESKWPSWTLLFALLGCIGVGLTTQAVLSTASLSAASSAGVTRLEPLCDASVRQSSGYLPVTNTTKYFYWYFESRDNPAEDPLVLWLNGGPGASSLIGLFAENGPCLLDPDTLDAKYNPHAWNSHANVIWLDQPANVGFSRGPPTSPSQVGPNVHTFLEQFLAQHPELRHRRLYLTGESYAGHYVPVIAHTILLANQKHDHHATPLLNLQGILIVNGLTNVQVQAEHELDMVFQNAYNVTLVPSDHLDQVKSKRAAAVELARACQDDASVCPNASLAFIDLQSQVNGYTTRNSLDIRQDCNETSCSAKTDAIATFLSKADVQTRLGVYPFKPFSVSNDAVMVDFLADIATNYAPFVETVLAAKLPVVLVAGDADLQCNWRGIEAWPKHLEWHGAEGYRNAVLKPHFIDHALVGERRAHDQLVFIRVFNAGHMVPQDQSRTSLKIFTAFLNHTA